MLTDNQLVSEARRLAAINQRLPVLLLLAHVPRPAKTRSIVDKGLDIGFRQIRDWNVTHLLKGAESANQVVKLASGWNLIEPCAALREAGVKMNTSRTVE